MPATATPARDRLVLTAHDLFYREGFHCVGLDQILDKVGVTKTTFYNHFESKESLILAVLKRHDRWWRDTFREMLRKHGGDTPRGQLMAVGEVLDEMLQLETFNGCIFVNVSVEFPTPHDPAHEAAADHKQSMEDLLTEISGYAGADDPKALARELSIVMEGSYVTRQVTGRTDTAEVTKTLVTMIVERRVKSESTKHKAQNTN